MVIKTLLYIPNCKIDKNTSASVFKYISLLSALVSKELVNATSKSCMSCVVYTFAAEAFKFQKC